VNRLEHETSPYLRQHADNPVDWYPWGEEAFARARAEGKPILLSVGYSSCHWCHVMAHESFENPDVAAVMNEKFVNVKVDREERPDVDAIYMQAVQAMTGSGGWPMTVFLDPDGRPFFGGTYFPPDDRQGMPGFVRILDAVDDAWRTRRDELGQQADQLHQAIVEGTSFGAAPHESSRGALTPAILEQAVGNLHQQYDARFGGFGRAPKFPQAMAITLLLDLATADPRPEVLEMATGSLDAMAAGGIYDQVGGGFHRYSVDAHWLVPHFEKMLYDQALLVRAYLHGWMVTGAERYRRVVEETITYVLRDLRHAAGGFFSAEDADSDGVEGKFYVWSLEELETLCGDALPDVVRHFGVTARGNFEDPHTGFRGNILHAVGPPEDRPESIAAVLPALFAAREQRVRPGLDDKVLLGWNALFLRSLVEAAHALRRDDWMDAARVNVRFLLRELRRDDGRLLRSWQDGRANLLAYAEDYAALLEALLTLAELDDVQWLAEARTVADGLVTLFADDERGGFFTTGADAEALIVRPKDFQDNATPSENSLAADGLLRLSALTGDADGAARAEHWLATLAPVLGEHPTAFAFLLEALQRAVRAPLEVAIVGDDGPARDALVDVLRARVLPASVRVTAFPGVGVDLTPLLADRAPVDGRPAAYVCERFACRLPVTTPDALVAELDARRSPR
jgi:uncharacterized protein YyaL (SSP411 family)